MIKTLIKRDGTLEAYDSKKPLGWARYGAYGLSEFVDCDRIVLDAVNRCDDRCTTAKLQETLIDVALEGRSWAHYLMAGRLYASQISKEFYPNGRPTVQALQMELAEKGLMYDLGYTDAEYQVIEDLINHDRDATYPHFRTEYIVKKYAIQVRTTTQKKIYETPQFVYMRMAMALAEEFTPGAERLRHVEKWYSHLSEARLNAPTPNYVNLGTPLRGYASCCIYTSDDTARSIGIGLHIAYTMTYMSAGCGTHLNTRSIGDAVRGGVIKHQGKLPYIRATRAMVQANLQNGRGGADTTTWSGYDPENFDLAVARNPMTPEDKRIRGIDYSMSTDRLMARYAQRKGQMFHFTSFTAPDLYEALYSGDFDRFVELYERYEADPMFVKKYFNVRELILTIVNEQFETGRYYMNWVDEMNRHSPFYDPVYASNLCVAPETLLMTDRGYQVISELENQPVRVWNGVEWSD